MTQTSREELEAALMLHQVGLDLAIACLEQLTGKPAAEWYAVIEQQALLAFQLPKGTDISIEE